MGLEHILVVDDDETILGLMELVLRRSGYEVDTAGGMEGAVADAGGEWTRHQESAADEER